MDFQNNKAANVSTHDCVSGLGVGVEFIFGFVRRFLCLSRFSQILKILNWGSKTKGRAYSRVNSALKTKNRTLRRQFLEQKSVSKKYKIASKIKTFHFSHLLRKTQFLTKKQFFEKKTTIPDELHGNFGRELRNGKFQRFFFYFNEQMVFSFQ